MRYLLIFMCLMLASPAYAEEEAKPETPITKWLAAESEVVKGLSNKDKETYFILRNKYGLIRAIRIVKKDVGNAVQKCGQANPDMQDQMKTRFRAWTNSVDPILKTADSYLRQEIREQTIVDKGTFDDMLELNDDAYDFQQSAIEKNVVTTVEACEKLLVSMDKTEEDMLRLMQGLLLPASVIQEQPKN